MSSAQPGDKPEAHPQSPGLSMFDLVGLPDDQRQLLNWMLRQGEVTLTEIAAYLAKPPDDTGRLLGELEARGFVQEIDTDEPTHYRLQRAQQSTRPRLGSNLWRALDS